MDVSYLREGLLTTDPQGLDNLKLIGRGEIHLPEQNLAKIVQKSALSVLRSFAEQQFKEGAIEAEDFALVAAGITRINLALDKQDAAAHPKAAALEETLLQKIDLLDIQRPRKK
jgi:hypothetical protein